MPIQSIQAPSAEEWLASLPDQGPTVIYKHSPFCGISARADREVEGFVRRHPDVEVHSVDVVHQRPLSDAIARLLGVTHSSPQVIVVEHGHAVWNESHYGITVEALEEQLAP
jgi:bacillithiol system protein YtxJ